MRDADELHEAASGATGLDEFGDADYRVALDVLLEAVAGASQSVTAAVDASVVRLLVSRLSSEAAWKARPSCLRNEIRAPLVITGLPRTGTTALHHLLSVDERFQWLPHWITPTPMIRPPRREWATHPAHRAVVSDLDERHRANPAARAAHNVEADLADECITVMAQSFTTMMFVSSIPAPGYHEWFLRADEGASYRRYADNLRLIGAEEPEKPWLLKNPSHTLGMADLLDVFPDARVVMTYRDPVESIPSGASLISVSAGSGWDPESLGRHRLRIWSLAAEAAEAVRRERPEQFHEVDYRDVVADPRAVVEGVYQRFGMALDDQTDRALERWIAANPPGLHGEHVYTPEQFGLTPDAIRERFGPYLERYGLGS